MKILTSSFFLISTASFIHAMQQPRDISYLLADSIDSAKYDAYARFMGAPSTFFAAPVTDQEEPFYANMVLVKEVEILQETKQMTPILVGLIKRCAVLAAGPFGNEWAARFGTMLNFVVDAAGQKKAETSMCKIRQELAQEVTDKEKWMHAAASWKSILEDALLNLANERAQKEQEKQREITALQVAQTELSDQNKKLSQQLSNIGHKLYESERRNEGLAAQVRCSQNELTRLQLAYEQLKNEAHKKSCENGRLKSKLQNAQQALSKK